ncbi:MAG TPA: hypothetical protein V6D06_07700 [Trichocoleus sp.]
MPRLTPDATAPTPYSVHGNVDIDGEAAIAPGVILTAAPGSRLVVSSGACLGAGVIIHAYQGDLVIEPEASVGSGVLVVGRGRVGAQTCIGAGSTLINPQLPPRSVIASRSLVGDPSCSLESPEEPLRPEVEAPLEVEELLTPEESPTPSDSSSDSDNNSNGSQSHSSENGSGNTNGNGNGSGSAPAYGRDQVNQLLNTLFPHRQTLGVSPPSRTE